MEDLTESRPAAEVEQGTSPDDAVGVRTDKFVTFRLGDGTYAVLAAAVAEVTQPLPLTALPISAPGLLGISPLRGEILAVLDLRHILGEAGGGSDPKSKQIVLKRPSVDAAPIAFAVDRIGEIASLDLSQLRNATCRGEFLIGETDIDGRGLKVINHSELAAAAKLD